MIELITVLAGFLAAALVLGTILLLLAFAGAIAYWLELALLAARWLVSGLVYCCLRGLDFLSEAVDEWDEDDELRSSQRRWKR